jgi:hypothetical protein
MQVIGGERRLRCERRQKERGRIISRASSMGGPPTSRGLTAAAPPNSWRGLGAGVGESVLSFADADVAGTSPAAAASPPASPSRNLRLSISFTPTAPTLSAG